MTEPMRLKITPEERTILKTEFDQLQTVEQKYNFWEEKFNIKYAYFFTFIGVEINDFMIWPKTEPEIAILNRLIYSDYNSLSVGRKQKKDQFCKETFAKEISSIENKEAFVEYEIKRIDDYVFIRKQPSKYGVHEEDTNNRFFIAGFENYLLRKQEFDWGEQVYEAPHLLQMIKGIELAKYREFVTNYNKADKKKPEIKLTGEQKFLLLHYLNFGNEVKANTNRSILFELFIDELKSNSIRPMFSDIRKYETEENLYALLSFFKLIKLDSKAIEITDKLNKLRKKK